MVLGEVLFNSRFVLSSGVFTIGDGPLKIYFRFFCYIANAKPWSIHISVIDILNWQCESGHSRLTRLLFYYLVLEL